MKKLLYYSPFIPVIGFVIHIFWIIFEYKIYSMNENEPKCFFPMALQGLYIIIFNIILIK